MLNDTRLKYDAYTMQIGKLNGVADTGKSFTVAPAVAQTLRGKIQASSAFLTSINIIPVVAQEGDKVGVGVKGTIASRTDTRIHDRQPRYPGDLDETRYRCEKTDFDTLIRYETLDAWAHQPNFQPLIRDAIVKAKALDIITIGFNGVKVAVETDPNTYAEPEPDCSRVDIERLKDRDAGFAGSEPTADPGAPLRAEVADLHTTFADHRDSSWIIFIPRFRHQIYLVTRRAEHRFEPSISIVTVRILDPDDCRTEFLHTLLRLRT